MNHNQVVESLRKEVKGDKTANDVMHVFAMRKRARNTLTVSGLAQRMKKEGFYHDLKEYSKVLKFMSDLGLGRLETDSKGRVVALKDIKMALQSIGLAAVGHKNELEGWRQRNKFTPLVAKETLVAEGQVLKTSEATKSQWGAGATASGGRGFPVSITVVVNGKPVNFRIPKELDENEIADLVIRFRDKGTERGV